ncbi:biotin-dependent carboxyltransferase family protein [Aeromicrobium senzhongii]|uniref:Biotin-dependent carboxyltransferase family protein n=1 Tax=Aeromicrobium senzhongii TaxID=2663859 RepID=A0ABX6SV36_9ACTN|nr:biotin-dependent carboxyltransferase family protein [Aeromicrobium senzhongii]MTB88058.1 5-oxoprolinase/urea amidolyase family protein [Aeromicrobium senzhongii]QNL94941.1 biotin-dependent carboxyltransferase family protein [Aeromicrobium senzhongii]
MSLRVLEPGPLTLVQDQGRPGLADLGVGPSGAFDQRALRAANRLVGNPEGHAVLEAVGGGLAVVATASHVVAVTGAVGPVSVDGRPVASGRVLSLRRGDVLRLGAPTVGMRWTLGVGGGFVPEPVLGSRSFDTMAALGPAPLSPGDELIVGPPHGAVSLETVPAYLAAGDVGVGVVLGPRDDWFTPAAITTLLSCPWRVDPVSDRIGVRLEGPPLERARPGELESEPVVRGSIQVTSSGRPVVLGPDHPVTGGYPVIGVVVDTDALAQVRPGDLVRFHRRRP